MAAQSLALEANGNEASIAFKTRGITSSTPRPSSWPSHRQRRRRMRQQVDALLDKLSTFQARISELEAQQEAGDDLDMRLHLVKPHLVALLSGGRSAIPNRTILLRNFALHSRLPAALLQFASWRQLHILQRGSTSLVSFLFQVWSLFAKSARSDGQGVALHKVPVHDVALATKAFTWWRVACLPRAATILDTAMLTDPLHDRGVVAKAFTCWRTSCALSPDAEHNSAGSDMLQVDSSLPSFDARRDIFASPTPCEPEIDSCSVTPCKADVTCAPAHNGDVIADAIRAIFTYTRDISTDPAGIKFCDIGTQHLTEHISLGAQTDYQGVHVCPPITSEIGIQALVTVQCTIAIQTTALCTQAVAVQVASPVRSAIVQTSKPRSAFRSLATQMSFSRFASSPEVLPSSASPGVVSKVKDNDRGKDINCTRQQYLDRQISEGLVADAAAALCASLEGHGLTFWR